jgi:hypothetical protein
MSNELKLMNPGDENESDIGDHLTKINESKFKFNCLGMGCLGWIIILIVILLTYFILRK